MEIANIRTFSVPDRWIIHSYYTLNPYAPDGSGRILCAGCDLSQQTGEVFVLDRNGKVLDRFGKQNVSAAFFHTGFWQSWGPDGKTVYYQSSNGDPVHPRVTVRELESGHETDIEADCEGTPPYGEPFLYGLSGMYYAAGYGDGRYHPEQSPVLFQNRDQHGLFLASPSTGKRQLLLSVQDILEKHPLRQEFLEMDARYEGGLTLMVYCVRFSRDGRQLLFHFGNHCVDTRRGEPRLLSLFTANYSPKDGLSEVRHALDLNFEQNGVHWSWDNRGGLLGYFGKKGEPMYLAGISRDGRNFHKISDAKPVGGHPSVSPADPSLIVTDGTFEGQGRVVFLKDGQPVLEKRLPRCNYENGAILPGRNPYFVCHHPVFNADGSRVLCNILPGKNAQLLEMQLF